MVMCDENFQNIIKTIYGGLCLKSQLGMPDSSLQSVTLLWYLSPSVRWLRGR